MKDVPSSCPTSPADQVERGERGRVVIIRIVVRRLWRPARGGLYWVSPLLRLLRFPERNDDQKESDSQGSVERGVDWQRGFDVTRRRHLPVDPKAERSAGLGEVVERAQRDERPGVPLHQHVSAR